ncbi:MAG TPA: serine protease [Stellaceae bacterium]|nr:serine protease [Stellaceae bacterium]
MRRWGALAAVVLLLAACDLHGDDWIRVAGRAPFGSRLLLGGTGFLIHGGYIVTARHVVEDCRAIHVTAASGIFEAAGARVAALPTNPLMDLALLRLDPAVSGLPPGAPLSDLWPSDTWEGEASSPWPKIEQPLFMVGYSGVDAIDPPKTAPLSQTIAARLTNPSWHGDALAVFGDITHGDSGSPVIDQSGRVVGVIFAVAFDSEQLRKRGIHGAVGFAFRARDLAYFLAEAGASPEIDDGRAATPVAAGAFMPNMMRVFCYR